jgi:predicted flap endonuclease-1-like 5' DNA nuclease
VSAKKIGVIVGREWSWPPAYIDEVNRRDTGVTAEFVKIGGTQMAEPCEYDLIIDRISHEIPYYRTYLKNAVLMGATVINNPFWWAADDKFFGACLATKVGVAHPRTVALPSHSYVEGVVEESLRNLRYPIPWREHVEYVGGFPVILKPAWGGGFKKVYKVNSYEELWHAYNETGTECMMLQQYIDWDKYVRCICIGKNNIMTIKFDANAPWPHRYFRDDNYLTDEEGAKVLDGARKLNLGLGYDMNTVEFAIKDGVPYAIDFTNPAPDFDVNSLTPHYFDWVVKTMADFTIETVQNKTRQSDDHRWSVLINLPNDLPAAAPVTLGVAEAAPAAKPAPRKASSKRAEGADPLIEINGIGPTFEKRLNAAGITTFAQVASSTVEQLRQIVGDSKLANVEDWIVEAQERSK